LERQQGEYNKSQGKMQAVGAQHPEKREKAFLIHGYTSI
jgi:hypothetical protein